MKDLSRTIDLLSQYLRPAGEGVFTVHTAQEKRASVQELLYGTTKDITSCWQKKLLDLPSNSLPLLLGYCCDTGAGITRGSNWGPLSIREKIYPPLLSSVFDLGDLRIVPQLLHDHQLNAETLKKHRRALYQSEEELAVSPLSILENVLTLVAPQPFLVLGGDHSLSFFTAKQALKNQSERTAVIHFDAHTDLLENRLGVTYCFATWAYHILSHLHQPQDLIQIGIRSSAHSKDHWTKTLGVQQFWSAETLTNPQGVAQSIVHYLKKENIKKIFLSFDIDVFDESIVSATGTPEKGGLTPYEVFYLLQEIYDHVQIISADLVEVAPPLASSPQDATLDCAGEVTEFLLGALT